MNEAEFRKKINQLPYGCYQADFYWLELDNDVKIIFMLYSIDNNIVTIWAGEKKSLLYLVGFIPLEKIKDVHVGCFN